MRRRDEMFLRDDIFELLRAIDPAKKAPIPDPDSPEARALFARIIATPRHGEGTETLSRDEQRRS